ncbi:SGNH/GDSL hydrolase family protein [Streptomyces sp. NPDC050315]|uniref:SGNH/GDSL hydrolase family protein n=1 Tax=Streptomyces sp. NPDC050315 TaxID=3155039 RepID=UPI0034375D76
MAAARGRGAVRLAHDDPRLRYRGAVSLQCGPGWTAPWRLPHDEAALHLPEGGVGRAAMPAGVRVTFRTDSPELTCRYQADPPPRLNGPQERPYLDVLCGERCTTVLLEADGRDHTFRVTGLPGRPAVVELWLPTYAQFRLGEVMLADGAVVWPDERTAPHWVHYGSSVSQGRGAASPARAWPALVARRTGWDLISLALGGACYLQPMTARLIRDLPADVITACVGINIQALGTHNADSLAAAVVGFVRTVRDGHPTTPFTLMSTIVAPDREDVPGPSGLTVAETRHHVRRAVELLRAQGDEHLAYLDGLEVFGADLADHLLEPVGIDRLHPSPAGHAVFADRFLARVGRSLCVPVTA